MTLNEYQHRAMSTCMDTCNNIAYMLTGLTAEVGEVNDKIAKAVRKNLISIHRNELISWQDNDGCTIFVDELKKELGDCLWFIAGLCFTLNIPLEAIAQQNLDKLASRQQRGVIDGSGDNR